MATQISLLSYLEAAPPLVPTHVPLQPIRNTRNKYYRASDIHSTTAWNGFDLTTIMGQYGGLLQQAQIAADPMPTTPPRAVVAEDALRDKVSDYITPRVRRALRAAFQHQAAAGQNNGITALVYDSGGYAKVIAGYTPDAAYYDDALPPRTSANRAPGEFKPSYKWSSAWGTVNNPRLNTQYKQVLSQVNYYMKQHGTRYGFVLTDRELVAIRRRDEHGNLELAPSIPFTTGGTAQQPQLTVLLALWYLGMLASQDQGPQSWAL